MANKQKAWRTAGKGRKAKTQYVTIKPTVSWLMQGLMIRAGLYDPLPAVEGSGYAQPVLTGQPVKRNWFSRAWNKAKAVFA